MMTELAANSTPISNRTNRERVEAAQINAKQIEMRNATTSKCKTET